MPVSAALATMVPVMELCVKPALKDRGGLTRGLGSAPSVRQTRFLAPKLRPQRTRAHLALRIQRRLREVTLKATVFAIPGSIPLLRVPPVRVAWAGRIHLQ